MNSNINDPTRELLKMSMLKVPDEDFSNRVMERIHLEAKQKKTFLSSISIAWIFTILSVAVIPFGLPVLVKDFQPISIFKLKHILIDSTTMSIIICTIFAIIILVILDNLIRLTFHRKHYFG